MKNWFILILALALVGFLVWANWPKKGEINPLWQSVYDAAINAGHTPAEASNIATEEAPKIIYTKK
jgi:hypothetical protein